MLVPDNECSEELSDFIKDVRMLKGYGWTVECESPLEIRHVDGSFATKFAATLIIQHFKEEIERQKL